MEGRARMRGLLLYVILTLLTYAGTAQHRKTERSCPEVFETHKGGGKQALRYASNFSLNKPDTLIKTLLIYVHGLHRNAMGYFEYAEDAVRSAGQKKMTLVIAPQYADAEDLDDNRLGNEFLCWQKAEWKDGYASIIRYSRSREISMSSYEVLDSLITTVLKSGKFPNIRKVVIAGHSAGGQFVQRYSAITPLPDLLPSCSFRFIVMDPSSYMYPDDKRPAADGTTFIIPDTTGCPAYNRYPKGLTELNIYAEFIGADQILHNMLQRDIVFLLGSNDTSMDDPDLDVSCVANLQGRFRLERGLYFIAHISSFPGYGGKKNFDIVPGVGHSGEGMINSDEAKKWIFGR